MIEYNTPVEVGKRMTTYSQFADVLRSKVRDGKSPIDGQEKATPRYWIEVTQGGAGWFAVLLWDGMGFPEPWETGFGRYATADEACVEASVWAAEEQVDFVPPQGRLADEGLAPGTPQKGPSNV